MRIPRSCVAWLTVASGLAAVPVAAQERPPFPPTRDVVVSYRVWDEGGRPTELRVAWSVALHALRAEARSGGTATVGGIPLPPGARLVLDLRAGRAFAAEDRTGLVLDLPRLAAEARQGERALAAARAQRLGRDRVAGLACTLWRMEPAVRSAGGHGRAIRVCLTGDGVPLHAQREGQAARAEALSVAYGPQDAALFGRPRGGLAGGAGEAVGNALGSLLGRGGLGAAMPDLGRGPPGRTP